MSFYSLVSILHILGVAFGAGGAFLSDFLLLSSLRDGRVDDSEFRLLKISGRVVWLGVFLLVISGGVLLWLSDFALLASSVFRTKLTIVGVIVLNGIFVHRVHLPFIENYFGGKDLSMPPTRVRKHLDWLAVSAAISSVSWVSAITLGYLRVIPYSYGMILGVYILVIFALIAAALFVEKKQFPIKKSDQEYGGRKNAIVPIILIVTFIFLGFAFFKYSTMNNNNNRRDVAVKLTPISKLKMTDPSERHVSYAPHVPDPIQRRDQRIFEVHLEVLENVCEIDPENKISFDVWGYRIKGDDEVRCGSPGPVLRGRVGDIARITLTNLPENKHTHNIDFHSVTGQGGGAKDLTVAPGETATIEARLLYPGVFMYHCAYDDVPEHIAQGLYGMFIVDPPRPLPKADHEWAVMQSEWYLTEPDKNGFAGLDRQKLTDEEPTYVTFNGRVDALIEKNSLEMKTGERARIFFVNEGLNLGSNFHPIGSHWDIVYPEGATHPANRVIHGSQSTLVVAGGGSVTELVGKVPSTIILVDHALVRSFYKGAIGLINVLGPEDKEIFSATKPAKSAQATHPDIETLEDAGSIDISIPPGAAKPENADIAYTPRELRIKAGASIKWTNNDSVMHTVTSGVTKGRKRYPDNKFDSGFLRPGETFYYTFEEPGTYPYYCTPHPWATGVVIVE
jgi:nitrite reductase (NO-forming)